MEAITQQTATSPNLTKVQLVEMLKSGKEGIKQFNKLRQEFPKWMPDLPGVNLTEADLSGANLSDAYLKGADLTEADLTGANLSDANLKGAKLKRALLHKANLSGADLSGAKINASAAELATTRGLETAKGAHMLFIAACMAGYTQEA